FDRDYKRIETMPLRSMCDDIPLLSQALTHVSFAQNRRISDTTGLATIGDLIVRVYIVRKATHILWNSNRINEGHFVLSHIHREDIFAQLFDTWELQKWILLGDAQKRLGCTNEMKENFVQALAGACFLSAINLEVALKRLDGLLGRYLDDILQKIHDPDSAVE